MKLATISPLVLTALFSSSSYAAEVIVGRGDTLSKIAAEQLGDANAWPQLCELNPDVLTRGCDILPVGATLKISADSDQPATSVEAAPVNDPAPVEGTSANPAPIADAPAELAPAEAAPLPDLSSAAAEPANTPVRISALEPEGLTLTKKGEPDTGEASLKADISPEAGTRRARYLTKLREGAEYTIRWKFLTDDPARTEILLYDVDADVFGRVGFWKTPDGQIKGTSSEVVSTTAEPRPDGWMNVEARFTSPITSEQVQLLIYPVGVSKEALSTAPEFEMTDPVISMD